jgi:hypothetical protein
MSMPKQILRRFSWQGLITRRYFIRDVKSFISAGSVPRFPWVRLSEFILNKFQIFLSPLWFQHWNGYRSLAWLQFEFALPYILHRHESLILMRQRNTYETLQNSERDGRRAEKLILQQNILQTEQNNLFASKQAYAPVFQYVFKQTQPGDSGLNSGLKQFGILKPKKRASMQGHPGQRPYVARNQTVHPQVAPSPPNISWHESKHNLYDQSNNYVLTEPISGQDLAVKNSTAFIKNQIDESGRNLNVYQFKPIIPVTGVRQGRYYTRGSRLDQTQIEKAPQSGLKNVSYIHHPLYAVSQNKPLHELAFKSMGVSRATGKNVEHTHSNNFSHGRGHATAVNQQLLGERFFANSSEAKQSVLFVNPVLYKMFSGSLPKKHFFVTKPQVLEKQNNDGKADLVYSKNHGKKNTDHLRDKNLEPDTSNRMQTAGSVNDKTHGFSAEQDQLPVQLSKPVGIAEMRSSPANPMNDLNELAEGIFDLLEQKMRTERERRGIFS